jgi:hypothetical protein
LIVVPYSLTELIRLFASKSEATETYLQTKQHKPFLDGYLAELGARTIVVEPDYTDKDYLQDYAGYYVSCFHGYARKTARFHFFSNTFDQAALEGLLAGDNQHLNMAMLQEAYQGFVVVKPLPQTILGRTCLKTYPSDNGRRNFPVVQDYAANLFGLQLKVSSLAFQEQDSVAAACATSALWSCFHATGRHFHHPIQSPTEITRAALISLPTSEVPETRAFPNRGLSPTQMANAVNAVGLDPQILGATNEHLVKSVLYAYLKGKIPIIFGIDLLEFDAADAAKPFLTMGKHAVTVGGYSLGLDSPVPHGPTAFKLRASRIDKFYVHDDQLGPFARMTFKSEAVAGSGTVNYMSTDWTSPSGRPSVIAMPKIMVLPLYRKIRVPFKIVHDAIVELDDYLETMRLQFLAANERPEWDIYLCTGAEFKSEVLAGKAGYGADAAIALKAPLPKYLWRATASVAGNIVCDFLFDATGLEQGSLLLLAKIHSSDLLKTLQSLATTSAFNLQTAHVLERFSPTSTSNSLLLTS